MQGMVCTTPYGNTLNVDTSVVKTEQEIRDIAIDVLADYQPIDPD